MPSFVAAVNRNSTATSSVGGGSEFSIQQEDFPALPGSHLVAAASASAALTEAAFINGSSRIVRDQYGMLGLLSFIKLCEENREDTRYIGRGVDPNSLGLPMTQPSNIHPLLASPWPEMCVATPQYTDHPVPQEYLVGPVIRLPAPPLEAVPVETLFWLFYACARDRLQLSAAKELHRRHWRWVKADRLWVTRSGELRERLPGAEGERGRYLYWDTELWSVQDKLLTIHYDQIDDSPSSFPDPVATSTAISAVSIASSVNGNGYHHPAT